LLPINRRRFDQPIPASDVLELDMPTPDFVVQLRRQIGTAPLFLAGVSVVVLDDAGRVLLVRRTDSSPWSVISGILEPGEQPAYAAVREVEEETGVRCRIEQVTSTFTLPPVTYENGDHCQFVDIGFRARYLDGDARVNDDESADVAWFDLAALPERSVWTRLKLKHALDPRPEAWTPGSEEELLSSLDEG